MTSPCDDRDTVALINSHLARRGLRDAYLNDPMVKAQVTILRDYLRLTHMAMVDQDIDPDVIDCVLKSIVYGALPGQTEIDAREEADRRMRALIESTPTRVSITDLLR